jgi:transposase-like protein
MTEKLCPSCEQDHEARITREAPGMAEWQCTGCGARWTVKDGHPGACFCFWPGDIDRACRG